MARQFGLVLAVLLAAAAPAARADEFCAGLKAIVAQSGTNFAALRLASAPAGSGQVTLILPGALPLVGGGSAPCQIYEGPKGEGDRYTCFFDGGDTAEEGLAALTGVITRVEACLALPPVRYDLSMESERGSSGSSDRGPIHIDTPDAPLQLGLIYPPDGGPGLVELSVVSRTKR